MVLDTHVGFNSLVQNVLFILTNSKLNPWDTSLWISRPFYSEQTELLLGGERCRIVKYWQTNVEEGFLMAVTACKAYWCIVMYQKMAETNESKAGWTSWMKSDCWYWTGHRREALYSASVNMHCLGLSLVTRNFPGIDLDASLQRASLCPIVP